MNHNHTSQSLWTSFKSYRFRYFIDDKDILEYAHYAYGRYVDWFGPPDDAKWPFWIMEGPYAACQRNYILRRYIITLDRAWYQSPFRLSIIGHEIFHRVTCRRKGLFSHIWVSEVMAECASRQILCESGRSDYAGTLAKYYRSLPQMKDINQFYNARPRRVHLGFAGWTYGENFHSTAFCLGAALESIVTWDVLRRLSEHTTIEAWICSLPEVQQILVRRILQLNNDVSDIDPTLERIAYGERRSISLSLHDHHELAYALFSQGRFKEAIIECQEATQIKPTSDTSYIYMGYALEESGHISEAITAYEHALRLNTKDTDIRLRVNRLLNQC